MNDVDSRLAAPSEFFRVYPTLTKLGLVFDQIVDLQSELEDCPAGLRVDGIDDLVGFGNPHWIEHWYESDLFLSHLVSPHLKTLNQLNKQLSAFCLFMPTVLNAIESVLVDAKLLLAAPNTERESFAGTLQTNAMESGALTRSECDRIGGECLGLWGYYFFERAVTDFSIDEIEQHCQSWSQMDLQRRPLVCEDQTGFVVDSKRYALCTDEGEVTCEFGNTESFRLLEVLWKHRNSFVNYQQIREDMGRNERDLADNYLKKLKGDLVRKLRFYRLEGFARAIKSAKKCYGLMLN